MTGCPDKHGNGWREWSKYVLKELERLNEYHDSIDKAQQKIVVEIAMLKVKSGVWGAIGGAIPVVIGLAILYMKKG